MTMYKRTYSDGQWRYWNGSKEITQEQYEKTFPPKPAWTPDGPQPFLCGDQHDFVGSYDPVTQSHGLRYYPQLARFPGDKSASFPHVNQAIEAAKRRGYTIERD